MPLFSYLHSLCTTIYFYLPYFTLNFIYIIGFLSTEDESASGNYGLKDQTMALRWIKEHITEFGGDPNNVTIQGESSAAVDVALHLVSPLSKGQNILQLRTLVKNFFKL